MAKGKKTGGRGAGTPNKTTTVFKQAVLLAYDTIGGHTRFAQWAAENPTEFYKIASRLIPQEVATTVEMKPLIIDTVTPEDVQQKRDGDSE